MRAISASMSTASSGLSKTRSLRWTAILGVVLTIGGCVSHNDVTGSIDPAAPVASSEPGAAEYLNRWSARYGANPNDKAAALNYAAGLRAAGRYAQAVAILETTAIHNPNDVTVLGAYGKALADVGRLQEAARVLANAQNPQRPDWSILSAQGAVADQLGDHAQAQAFYTTALKIQPGEPSVMSNLGLSYALSKQLDKAEAILRQASADARADARVRQNFALVLALRGKFAEAEKVDRVDLPPDQATANVNAIRKMIAQSNTWRDIQQSDASPARSRAASVRFANPG